MSQELITTCDVCGITKGKTNHWWKVWLDNGVFHTCPAEKKIYFPEGTEEYIVVKDVCGQGDAMYLYNTFLSNGSLEINVSLELPDPTPPPSPTVMSDDDIPF